MVVGITGGIGSGKSTVSSIIKVLGYSVYNSDSRSHELVNSDSRIVWSIKNMFGDELYQRGVLDRKALAAIVFKDRSKLKALNEVIHPAVSDDFIAWKHAQQSKLLFKEAAILFESGAYRMVDSIILVKAPELIRIDRVMRRDGVEESLVKERISNQWSDEEKEKLSDYIISADDKHLVIPQVLNIIAKLNNE